MSELKENKLPQALSEAEKKKSPFTKLPKPGSAGIRVQLVAGFLLFTVIILVILWVFQILMLNRFYREIKISEAKSASLSLKKALDEDDVDVLVELAEQISFKGSMHIRIADSYGRDVLSAVYPYPGGYRMYLIDQFSQSDLSNIYKTVTDRNSYLLEEYDLPESAFSHLLAKNQKGFMFIENYQSETGDDFIILLESELTPLDATVDTLKVQLYCINIIMLVLGVGLALFIARRLSRPIVAINNKARKLAAGNYDIRFEEKGSRELRELARTLSYAATELSKVEELRRELIANVSHDLRTPLTMIKGYSEVMRDLPGENTPENIQVIADEASHLSELVSDMLNLSKLEAGAEPLHPEKFNLTEDIREILKRYGKFADYRFILYCDEDVYVNADRLKITQVIYNLINNAVNYAGEDKTIVLRQLIEEDRVRIEVTDTGEGIPAEKLPDIWDRYYKVDKEHKRAQAGTGLGLSIVKNILDMHGGSYGVRSSPGNGSTFWFELELSHDS